MSRELRRVPVDFDWPLGKVWPGYLQPEVPCCPDCQGNGETAARGYVGAIAHLLLVCAEGGTTGRLHPWTTSIPLRPEEPPSADMAELGTGLAGRPASFLGHDACDRMHATSAIIKAAGLDERWGICRRCGGHGVEPEHQVILDAWTRTDPPTGDGWQIWETVSEGSPITPVFPTKEALIEWMQSDHPEMGWPWHAMTRAGAEKFAEKGWVISMVMTPAHGVELGLEHMDRTAWMGDTV